MPYPGTIKLYVIPDSMNVPPPLRGDVKLSTGEHYYFVDPERGIALVDYEAAGNPRDIFPRDAAAWTIEWGRDPSLEHSDWKNVYDEMDWEDADVVDCTATYEDGEVTWHQ